MINITLVVELLMVCLLGVTIGYAIILNQRLKTIDQNKEHLKQILQGFSASLLTAERSIHTLQQASKTASELVQKNLNEAKQLRDDLDMLTKRGEKVADNIEKVISSTRNITLPSQKTTEHLQRSHSTTKNQEIKTGVSMDHMMPQGNELEDDSLHDVKQHLVGKLKALR